MEPWLHGAAKIFEFSYRVVIFLPAKVLHARIVLFTTVMIIFMLCAINVCEILLILNCRRNRNEQKKENSMVWSYSQGRIYFLKFMSNELSKIWSKIIFVSEIRWAVNKSIFCFRFRGDESMQKRLLCTKLEKWVNFVHLGRSYGSLNFCRQKSPPCMRFQIFLWQCVAKVPLYPHYKFHCPLTVFNWSNRSKTDRPQMAWSSVTES